MTVLNVKQQAQSLIEKLPDNCTWDDIMQQVYVILAVEAGLADSQAGRVKSVEEVRSQFGLINTRKRY
jgi:predicted transcriptional regulator